MGARRYYIQSALSVSDPDKMGLQTNFCIDATVKSAFERGYKVIVPQGANSTFDNYYMTGEETYKYYNDMMWPKRFAICVSVDELKKVGAKAAWLKIQEIDESACINRLMALEGAIEGVKKTMLSDEVKADLKEFYQWNKK